MSKEKSGGEANAIIQGRNAESLNQGQWQKTWWKENWLDRLEGDITDRTGKWTVTQGHSQTSGFDS